MMLEPPESVIHAVDLNVRSTSASLLVGNNSLHNHQTANLKSRLESRIVLHPARQILRKKMRRCENVAGTTQAPKKQFLETSTNRITHKEGASENRNCDGDASNDSQVRPPIVEEASPD